MTVEQFKSWFDGFTDALQLDLVSGFDSSDLEDVFDKVREKLAEIEVPNAAPNQFPLRDVSPLTPNQVPLTQDPSPRYPNSPSVPGYIPKIYFTDGKGVTTEIDRLSPTWIPSYTGTLSSNDSITESPEKAFDPNRVVPRRG